MLVSADVLLTEAPMSGDRTRFYRTCKKIRSSPHIEIGEIQEAIFEEKIFRIFFTQKKVFFLASQYKTGLYLDLLLENRI